MRLSMHSSGSLVRFSREQVFWYFSVNTKFISTTSCFFFWILCYYKYQDGHDTSTVRYLNSKAQNSALLNLTKYVFLKCVTGGNDTKDIIKKRNIKK
jgi:hypothetical protein